MSVMLPPGCNPNRKARRLPTMATLMADVTRYKKDGSILERLRAFYSLRNDGKSWKIVTISMANPPFTGPGDIARD